MKLNNWNLKADDTWLSPKNDISHLVANMNNKHQELIDKKVAEFTKLFEGKNIFGSWMIINMFRMHITDTIDTVLEEERERVFQALPEEMIVHEYMPNENTPARRGWNDYRMAVIKALDKTPPNTV